MTDSFQKSVEGLESSDPQVVLDSASWLIENAAQNQNQAAYMKACEMLYAAAGENVDCAKYIDEKLVKEIGFKAQLLSFLLKDGSPDHQQYAEGALSTLIDNAIKVKAANTEAVAQVYSAIQETGRPELLAKSKKLL